jgi:hypothetical protein
LWANSGEEKDKGQVSSAGGADKGEDGADSILPIDVPPMTPDESFAVPVMQESNERPARYAMNPGHLDSSAAQTPFPAAGGASPLPANQGAYGSDATNGAEAPANTAGQSSIQSGRYGAYNSPLGNPIEGASVADETAEPLGAATQIDDRTDATGQPGETGAISRGQDDAAGVNIGDIGNSLRSSARSAFASDAEGTAIAGDAGGYRAAAAIPEGDYGAIGAATQQASQPAPMTVAEAAEPLYGSTTPPLPLGSGEQPYPAAAGVVAESPHSSAAGGAGGGESGYAGAGVGALAADTAREQDTTYGGGYSSAGDIGSSAEASTGVGAYGSASAADAYASNSYGSGTSQQPFGDANASVPRALNSLDATGAAQYDVHH